MVNYNQQYKDQVICSIINKDDPYPFDVSLDDSTFFSAVGQKTSNSLNKVAGVYQYSLISIKPDTFLNFDLDGDSPTLKIYDDSQTLITQDLSMSYGKRTTNIIYSGARKLFLDYKDTNVRFDNFAGNNPMVKPISSLKNNVINFNATITVPSDVKCNYTTGAHLGIKDQPINVLFDGNIKKGDTITIKRTNHQDQISRMNFDTDLALSVLGIGGVNSLELVYKHLNPEPTPPTSQVTPPASQATPPTSQATPPTSQAPTPTDTQVDLVPTLQNAKVIVPAPVVDDNSTTHYYLDPKHTTVTLKATAGYTFENDGSLTYQQTEYLGGTLVIKATHTDTVTFTLPDDLDWDAQFRFDLTMGAVKGQVAESSGAFTNIYKADYTNLLKFSSEMIVKIQGGYGGAIKAYDVTPYINNLVMLPFNVPTGEPAPIVAGSETFTTQLPTVDDNYLTVDLGKITVDEQYKNAFDYYQVKARLMLPYTSMIDLDVKHVINKTIAIKYIVNVVNGDTTINLYNDTDLFYSEQVNLASEIPFINNVSDASQYVVINQLKTMFRNDIHQAYIIIEQPTPVLNSDYYSTDEKGTLQGYTGNVKVRLLNNLDINVAELNALQNLLETGVKIK